MRLILLFTILIGLFCCSRPKESFNSVKPVDSLEFSPQNDYIASTIYRSLDSDSLSIDKKTVDDFLLTFILNGQQVSRNEYGGGDCFGVYRTYNLDKSVTILTIDKYDCGEYGFGNSQYLTKGDSVTQGREFTVEWDAIDNKTPYRVTERTMKFANGKSILKERQKSISRLTDLKFDNVPYNDIDHVADEEYARIRKELIDKGRIEL